MIALCFDCCRSNLTVTTFCPCHAIAAIMVYSLKVALLSQQLFQELCSVAVAAIWLFRNNLPMACYRSSHDTWIISQQHSHEMMWMPLFYKAVGTMSERMHCHQWKTQSNDWNTSLSSKQLLDKPPTIFTNNIHAASGTSHVSTSNARVDKPLQKRTDLRKRWLLLLVWTTDVVPHITVWGFCF